jgi:TPP-dependent 2-oxoacid decarboxylase
MIYNRGNITNYRQYLSFIEVHLDRFDCSQGLTRLGQALRSPHA